MYKDTHKDLILCPRKAIAMLEHLKSASSILGRQKLKILHPRIFFILIISTYNEAEFVPIWQIPSTASIWLAPQCTENGRHCPCPQLVQPQHIKNYKKVLVDLSLHKPGEYVIFASEDPRQEIKAYKTSTLI
jgi:hypothetical protein